MMRSSLLPKHAVTQKLVSAFLYGVSLLLLHCGSSQVSKLEEARFSLDTGNFADAVTKANDVLTHNPNDVQAALVLSSGYTGRAGIKLLSIADDLANSSKADDVFGALHDALVANVLSLDDLHSAITTLTTTLTAAPGNDDPSFKDYYFQLGILEAIEAFSLPPLTVEALLNGSITPDSISSDMGKTVLNDFLNSDDHLSKAGFSPSDAIIKIIRQNYCVLQNASPVGTGGFTVQALRDLNECELSPNRDTLGITTPFPFESGITNCTAFNFTACSDAGDTTLNR